MSAAEDINHGSLDTGAEDLYRAGRLVVAIGGLDYSVRTARLSGDPWSKARARFTKTGRPYQDTDDRNAELRTGYQLRRMADKQVFGNVALACIFYRSNWQRVDTDNLLKHVCDSANGVLWKDDSQVTAIAGVLEIDPDHPRTVIAIAPHNSTLKRGTDRTRDCARCSTPFVVTSSTTGKKYCSPECSAAARGWVLAGLVPCEWCQQLFRRGTSTQKFCSVPCRAAAKRGVPKGGTHPSLCVTCGMVLTHYRGGRCRSCWRADPRPQ